MGEKQSDLDPVVPKVRDFLCASCKKSPLKVNNDFIVVGIGTFLDQKKSDCALMNFTRDWSRWRLE
jgi:hypothetical protein